MERVILIRQSSRSRRLRTSSKAWKVSRDIRQRTWKRMRYRSDRELKSSKDKPYSLENFVISEVLSNQMQVNLDRILCNKDKAFSSFLLCVNSWFSYWPIELLWWNITPPNVFSFRTFRLLWDSTWQSPCCIVKEQDKCNFPEVLFVIKQ